LPIEVIAYAGCILDALSPQFSHVRRELCGWSKPSAHDFYFGSHLYQQSAALADLVVLAALALAQGYIDDGGRSNSHWAKIEAAGRFEAKEIEAMKMCILQDVDYGLFRINEERVQREMRNMQRACGFPCSTISSARKGKIANGKDERWLRLSVSTGGSGIAVWAHGVQTPEPSP
jgi:hypothetical protein